MGFPSHETIRSGNAGHDVLPFGRGGGKAEGWLDVSVFPPLDHTTGQTQGTVTYARNIAARRRAESEEENLVTERREAFAKIKSLRGFIPICTSCKKIRNDKGSSEQVEGYLRDRSDADFSHSICRDCAIRLYGDL